MRQRSTPHRVDVYTNIMKYVLPLLALALILLCALFLRADQPPVPAPDQRTLNSVTLNYTDGSAQTLSAATQPAPAGAIPPNVANPPTTLGINLEGLTDWERSFMFIDAMRTARKFGTAQVPHSQNAPLDANGWPTTDAGTLVMTEVKNINGTYRLFATGQAEITAIPAQVRNYTYDERSNRCTAEIVVNQPRDQEVTLILIFKNTFGGLKNIKLIRPGYDSDAEIFTKEFKRAIAPFGAVRFMDYLSTNDSQIKTWDDRVKPTDATFSIKGGPYEYAIEMGNRTGKDIWLCVPALADDDHVKKLGELVRTKLRQDLNCYVEYSNEVWNGQFKQYKQNFDLAREEAKNDLSLTRAMNDFYRAWWRVGKRAVEIKKLMNSPGADDPRIKIILASQVGYAPPATLVKEQLEYIERNFGPPSKYIYAIACAPYFSPGKDPDDPKNERWYTQRDDLTVDKICDRLLAKTDSAAGDYVKAFHKLAAKYGIKSFAYEAGLDMQQYPTSLDAKFKSNYDPRMGVALEGYLTNWYKAGGDSLFYFNLNCRFGKFGYWGLTEDARNLATPKYQAAVRVSDALKQQRAQSD